MVLEKMKPHALTVSGEADWAVALSLRIRWPWQSGSYSLDL